MVDIEFQDQFGIIFHWGLYSIPAYDVPKLIVKRKIQNGSEWYAKRLSETGKFRPVNGWKETQEYHKMNYPSLKYQDFAKEFDLTSKNCDIDNWMKLCKSINAEYVIITSKHHDGYCLFETKTTDYHSKRNIVKEFGIAAKKYKMKFGIYYSWYEFDQNPTKHYMDSIVISQINELLSYSPDIFWFDGDWIIKSQYAKKKIKNICKVLKKKNIKFNDRVCDPNNGSYKVFSDRFIPKEEIKEEWEHINTIGLSWGYLQRDNIYKSSDQLLKLYKEVINKGGKFLLNLAPDKNGKIDINEEKIIKEFSDLKRMNVKRMNVKRMNKN